jgi:hypothetical protein
MRKALYAVQNLDAIGRSAVTGSMESEKDEHLHCEFLAV